MRPDSASQEAELLALFAGSVLRGADLDTLLERVRETYSQRAVSLLRDAGRRIEGQIVACVGQDPCADVDSADTAIEVGDDEFWMLMAGRKLPARDRRVLTAVAKQAAGLVKQRELAEEAGKAEAIAQADELRRSLLSAVSHDLRTPLAAAKAAVSSLRSDDVDFSAEDTAELLATIEESIDQLTALVGNLLDSSRLAAGVVQPELRRVYLEEDGAAGTARNQQRRHRFRPAAARPGQGGSRRRRRDGRQRSARAGAGQPASTTRCATRPTARSGSTPGQVGDRVLITVVDEGPGIPRGAEEQLFAAVPAAGRPRQQHRCRPGPFRRPRVRRGDGRHHLRHRHPGRRADRRDRPGCTDRGAALVTRVLVIDDEPQILRALRINLSVRGYEVTTAATGADALRAAAEHRPDVIVLDLGLPDMAGIEVLAGLRGLADRAGDRAVGAHRLRGQGGGPGRRRRRLRHQTVRDGRVAGPAARRGAARRSGDRDRRACRRNISFTVDLAAKKVTKNGAEVHLTPTEWGMLEMLVRNRGKLVGREELLKEVWGPAYAKETHYLRVYLAQLRRKLEDDPSHPEHLLTEAGMGYRFEP